MGEESMGPGRTGACQRLRRARACAWLAGPGSIAALGVWAAPAGAVTFQVQKLPFPSSGAGSLDAPNGLAVDAAGDVFVGNNDGNSVVELSPSVPSGSLALTPASGPAGTSPSVSSVTPCPPSTSSPTGFASSRAQVKLETQSGTVVQTATATLDGSGDWAVPLTIPASATNGTTYVIAARCTDPEGYVTENYADGAFVVQASSGGTTGPAGPAGPAGSQGPTGATGAQGPAGPAGTPGQNGTNGTNGINGAPGPAGPSPTASTIKCTNTLWGVVVVSTTCTVTYTYSGSEGADMVNGARAEAVTRVGGRTSVIGTGRIRGHELVLRFRHLKRRRYRFTVLELRPHHQALAIEHSSLVVS
jgi:collagen triple helix repeat protein